MRIFLDANILFSAAKSDGAVRRLLQWLVTDGHECWVDGYVVEEARRNLALKEGSHGVTGLPAVLAQVRVALTHSGDPRIAVTLPLPQKDQPVLAAAIAHRCDVLLTGDRTHFGRLFGRMIRGVTVHSPRTLAERLLGE